MDCAQLTVAAALRLAAQRLDNVSDTPRLDAELLMALALDTSRSELLLRHMDEAEPERFASFVRRREAHEPVAYICGVQEFYGRAFAVQTGVLIPRADSETAISAALDTCKAPRRILDCGTGSGALLLTLLAEYENAQGIGIDRSAAALDVAVGNAARLSLSDRVSLLERDWTKQGWRADLGRFDLVVANPPYVEENAELSPAVSLWEPGEALFAGPEGLDDYDALIPQLPMLLAPAGVAVLEIGASQADRVAKVAAAAGFHSVVGMDLAGRPRVLVLRLGVGKQGASS